MGSLSRTADALKIGSTGIGNTRHLRGDAAHGRGASPLRSRWSSAAIHATPVRLHPRPRRRLQLYTCIGGLGQQHVCRSTIRDHHMARPAQIHTGTATHSRFREHGQKASVRSRPTRKIAKAIDFPTATLTLAAPRAPESLARWASLS